MKKKSNFWKTLLTLIAAAAGLMLVRLLLLGLLVSGLFLALFSACSEHPSPHSRREVLAYLREEYPGEEFTVEKRWTPHVTREGYEAGGRVWNCYYEDLPEVLFQAVSFRRNGGPIPQSSDSRTCRPPPGETAPASSRCPPSSPCRISS